jgi:hypothetical protein
MATRSLRSSFSTAFASTWEKKKDKGKDKKQKT